jgi:hypothetical protein
MVHRAATDSAEGRTLWGCAAGLARCGASTVIATEEIIDTRTARAVASAVVPLLDAVGPGEALRAWRAREFANGNPLGFMLTCFGSADVTVPALRS